MTTFPIIAPVDGGELDPAWGADITAVANDHETRIDTIELRAPYVEVSRSTALALTALSFHDLTWDTEVQDNGYGMYPGGSSATFTIPNAGAYCFTPAVGFASNATGFRRVFILVNGSIRIIDSRGAVNGDNTHVAMSNTFACLAGDLIKIQVQSSVSLNLIAGATCSITRTALV